MTIKFISLNEKFVEIAKMYGLDASCMDIRDYKVERKTYFVSPANSLGFMDGGYDLALSRDVMPGIERNVKKKIAEVGRTNLLGRKYLPIGSYIILDSDDPLKKLVVSPTMLLPQDVSNTNNAYYSALFALEGITTYDKDDSKYDIILTSLCCGYGKMDEEKSVAQIVRAIQHYRLPSKIDFARVRGGKRDYLICEPNLLEQPKIYQNTEWFNIDSSEVKNI